MLSLKNRINKSTSLNRINSTYTRRFSMLPLFEIHRKIKSSSLSSIINTSKMLNSTCYPWKIRINKSTSLNRINSTNKKVLLCYPFLKFTGKLNQLASVQSIQQAKCLILLVLLENDWKKNQRASKASIQTIKCWILLVILEK